MSHATNVPAATKNAVATKPMRAGTAPANTKDAGRVKFGGMGIRYTTAPVNTKDAGRVRFGGMGIRF